MSVYVKNGKGKTHTKHATQVLLYYYIDTKVENIILFFFLPKTWYREYLVEMVKMIDGFLDSILLAFMDDI